MVCLGVETGAADWKVQTNPLSYGGTPKTFAVWKLFEWPVPSGVV